MFGPVWAYDHDTCIFLSELHFNLISGYIVQVQLFEVSSLVNVFNLSLFQSHILYQIINLLSQFLLFSPFSVSTC